MTKPQRTKAIKAILKKDEITRDEAHFLIKTALNMSFKTFCEKFGIGFHFLNDSLMMRRPFSVDLQQQILKIARDNFKN